MATQDTTTPYDALTLIQERYVALWDVAHDYLGHGNSVLSLLQGLNEDFERLLDAWPDLPDLQPVPQVDPEGVANGQG